jgi:glycosyltransferase involved in cell wall biosynthesis
MVIADETAARRTAALAMEPQVPGGATLVIASILRDEGTTGVHTHVRELRRELLDLDVPVEVVTPFSSSRALSMPIMGLRLIIERISSAASIAWYYHWHEVFLRRGLRRRLARLDDAVVYAQGPREARAALGARRGQGQRVVMIVHYMTSQADEWVDKQRLRRGSAVYNHLRRIEASVIPRVDGIVYVSNAARASVLRWLPAAGDLPSEVIPDFIRRGPVRVPDRREADLVTVGSLVQAKNHRYLLEILAAAKRSGHAYTLDIIGEGPMRRTLERAARSLGVDSQVRFRGVRHDVRDLLPSYRAYVHTSFRESLSLAIIEAAEAGLPLVVADTGGVREICDVQHGATVWSLDDADRAATLLITLMEDDGARRRCATASTARFREAFDADVVLPRLSRFLFEPDAQPDFEARVAADLAPGFVHTPLGDRRLVAAVDVAGDSGADDGGRAGRGDPALGRIADGRMVRQPSPS